MQFVSTRNKNHAVSLDKAILFGAAPDGGLSFVDVTGATGIGHEQCPCGPGLWNEHSFLSGGAAAGDYDRDANGIRNVWRHVEGSLGNTVGNDCRQACH